ncbi:SH3 domain-containing protein [Kordia zhangzhouensis]|uniref:SH3 domain-containing protein n=1 Tax=Kordia zhangzhouensis TaxID=1620405 RepID=UPI0006291F9E|nr:SH3 domain-containing protein [Kordia zhangzhouensis]
MKLKSLILRLLFLIVIILLNACVGKAKKNASSTNDTEITTETITDIEDLVKNTYYIWVDKINVRETPNSQGKIVGTYTNNTLEILGEKSDQKETIVLRNVAYEANWFKVKTKDNKEGWVFGGAIKQEGDDLPEEEITTDTFDFPFFGKFNLTTWADLGMTRRLGGDAETSTYRFMKDGEILEIEKTEVGEYGYHHTYKLMDTNENLLKERNFSFTVNTDSRKTVMELTEIVKDYEKNKQYSRSQNVNTHFMQMNARPLRVNGEWKVTDL